MNLMQNQVLVSWKFGKCKVQSKCKSETYCTSIPQSFCNWSRLYRYVKSMDFSRLLINLLSRTHLIKVLSRNSIADTRHLMNLLLNHG